MVSNSGSLHPGSEAAIQHGTLKNAQEAVRLYDEPESKATPDFGVDRVTDAEDVREMIEDDESEH